VGHNEPMLNSLYLPLLDIPAEVHKGFGAPIGGLNELFLFLPLLQLQS
jgi:hypothetical protein